MVEHDKRPKFRVAAASPAATSARTLRRLRLGKFRLGQVGALEARVLDDRVGEVGLSELGLFEHRISQVGRA